MNYMQDLWGETSIRHSLPEESIAMGVFFQNHRHRKFAVYPPISNSHAVVLIGPLQSVKFVLSVLQALHSREHLATMLHTQLKSCGPGFADLSSLTITNRVQGT